VSQDKPKGQLFTHTYLDRGQPTQDSELFRRRLGGYIQSKLWEDRYKLVTFIKTETGLSVPGSSVPGGVYYGFEDFLVATPIQYVLNIITLLWRFNWDQHKTMKMVAGDWQYVCPQATEWREFVSRVLREENIGYTLDEYCGVHFLVDQEFSNNKASILRGLDSPRYLGVKAAFEAAHGYLDSTPPDTKASVRSMFESLEILTKLMVQTQNLNKWVVENKLKQLAQDAFSTDDIASATIGSAFDGFALWVNGLHNYRHGQGTSEPVAPPLSFTVYVLSSGAAFLRWLIELDRILQSRSNPPLNPDAPPSGAPVS